MLPGSALSHPLSPTNEELNITLEPLLVKGSYNTGEQDIARKTGKNFAL